MAITIAKTDAEVMNCYPVMQELRPHILEDEFLARVRRQQASGYRLAFLRSDEGVVAVAGFRLGENLAWGHFLYVDDLVSLALHRSKGHGSELLTWLREYAVREGCQQLHLDSGLQRLDAHRFYEREGMSKSSLHFAELLTANRE
jgi:GNAT superfamily N-acetyltransferase